jgi:NhaA family Na+:H+ antiporter
MEAPLHRFVHALHPVVAFVIMPLFALANSGIDLSRIGLSGLLAPVALGAALGLFVGKQVGVFAFTFLATRLRLAPIPGGAGARQLFGVAVISGIGFTVALFIATLAYRNAPALLDQAKLGILVGSLASGLGGFVVLRLGRSSG